MSTRYSIPKVTDIVSRLRLFERIDRDSATRVFLILGQAAQGKSTLAASFLKQKNQPCIWCHLAHEASDHTRLFEILMTGIQDQLEQTGSLLETQIPQTTLGTREDLLRQAETLSTLLEKIDFPFNIVFDDLESLDTGASSFILMEKIIRENSGRTRFFLLSRVMPPLNLQRLKMENQVLVLDNEDLAFTSEETLNFFQLKLNSPEKPGDSPGLGPREIAKILKVTEGWAGGLTLVSESFKRFRSLEKLPDRMSSDAFSYFSQEIYQAQPPPIRSFLRKTSIFNHLDTRVLHAFFEDLDPTPILEDLENRNLFIQKIDSHPSWPIYKYNRLFRDFLKTDLVNTLESEKLAALDRKAGDIFWEMKRHEDAAHHYIRARAFEQMARIIRIKGTHYVVTGQTAGLAEWIEKLPDEMVREDAWLLFFKAMTLRIKGGKKNLKTFSQALEMFNNARDHRGMILSIAFIIEAAVFIRQPSPKILKWIEKGEAILRERRGSHKYTWARTILWQHIGLGYIAGTGDIPGGISACQNAILLANGIKNPDLLLNASIIMTLGLVESGDFKRARKMLDKIQTITGHSPHPEYRALKRITSLDYALKRGDFDQARILLEKSEADIDKFGLIFLYPGFVEARSVFFASIGEYTQALQAADHLSDFSILEGNDFYLGISHRLKATVFLLQEDYAGAVQEAKLAKIELGPSKRGDIHYFLARQILGVSLFFNNDLEGADQELGQALSYFRKISSDLFFCETAFMAGLTAWELKDRSRAVLLLNQGLDKAESNQYAYFPMIHQKTLARILVTLHLAGKDRSLFLFAAMSKGKGDVLREEILKNISSIPAKKKAAQAETLRPLYRLSLPGIRINTLGEFNVEINASPLDPGVFGGLKPKSLLKAIILYGLREIPREMLIETLWPEAPPAAGEKNFKINLHRLRKALEPCPDKVFGYSYILLKAGLVSLDPDLVSLDIDEFLTLADQARTLEEEGRTEQAIEVYGRAVSLYRGDYFSEDPYLEEAFAPRESLRAKLIETLGQKARLHEELDQWDQAVESWNTVLKNDPLLEQGYRNLMILHADAGRINEAIQIFKKCRAILKKELDAAPGAKTMALYRKIENLLPG